MRRGMKKRKIEGEESFVGVLSSACVFAFVRRWSARANCINTVFHIPALCLSLYHSLSWLLIWVHIYSLSPNTRCEILFSLTTIASANIITRCWVNISLYTSLSGKLNPLLLVFLIHPISLFLPFLSWNSFANCKGSFDYGKIMLFNYRNISIYVLDYMI